MLPPVNLFRSSRPTCKNLFCEQTFVQLHASTSLKLMQQILDPFFPPPGHCVKMENILASRIQEEKRVES